MPRETLPDPAAFTLAGVQKPAKERAANISSTWDKIHRVAERYEGVARKRWRKKTKPQRIAIITRAWNNQNQNNSNNMSPVHNPDYAAYVQYGPQGNVNNDSRLKDAYLWPYINVEDLAGPKNLLLFLNSRARNQPGVFARADLQAARLGGPGKAGISAVLPAYRMLLGSIEDYGEIVPIGTQASTNNVVESGYPPGEGLLILQIQLRYLEFQLKCWELILHDIPLDSLLNGVVMTEPPFLLDDEEWTTSASNTREIPYRLPASCDFDLLKSLVSSRLTEAQCHIQRMREDPGYFMDIVGDWGEHRREQIRDKNGVRYPLLDTHSFWASVLRDVVNEAYKATVTWEALENQLALVLELRRGYYSTTPPKTAPLPPDYLKAFLAFNFTVDQLKNTVISLTETAVCSSPSFRNFFERETETYHSKPNHSKIQSKKNLGPRKNFDQTLWLFMGFWSDEYLSKFGLLGLVDQIEHRLEDDARERNKISVCVERLLADLGVIAQVEHEMNLYQPWTSASKTDLQKCGHLIQPEYEQQLVVLKDIEKWTSKMSLEGFGKPPRSQFNYPSDRRQTKETINSMRSAENNLDLFWAAVDKQFREQVGKLSEEKVHGIFKLQWRVERTAAWVEPDKKLTVKTETYATQELQEPLSKLRLESINDQAPRFIAPEPKVKEKTRGKPQEEHDNPQPVVQAPLLPVVQEPKFTVKPRIFEVFRVLFHVPNQRDLPGEIPWIDFLHAMVAIGFVPMKLYGSVWQFTPTDPYFQRSFQEHDPHPKQKINFGKARRIGRHLRNVHGLHGGMLTLG